MLSRKEQNQPGILFPDKWREKVETILHEVYNDLCEATNKSFQVHGLTYPDELFLAVGLLDKENLQEAPVTYVVSLDLDESQKDQEKNLETLVDSMGVFFDQYFSDPDWNNYVSNWTEAEYKKLSFYYKVSRENVALSIQAEALLNQ